MSGSQTWIRVIREVPPECQVEAAAGIRVIWREPIPVEYQGGNKALIRVIGERLRKGYI